MQGVRFARALCLVALLAAAAAQPAAAAAPFTPWCGGAPSATDRLPDAVSGFEIHVVYAIPSDGTDRFAERASALATDAAWIATWWQAQDSGRRPRFDLYAFPGCASAFGQLNLTSARLPHDSSYYRGLDERYSRIREDLDGPPFGLSDPDKKYLVYYDGLLDGGSSVCGQADAGLIEGGPDAYSIVYLGGACGGGLGAGGVATVIAAHELIHGLNALVPAGPPNACPGDRGHPCDNPRDILAPSQFSDVLLDTLALDVGRDDYYGHSGSWWDVQDSPFLARLDSPDQAPPGTPGGFTATSRDGVVTLSWRASTDDVGPVAYRVYRDGALIARTGELRYEEEAADGETRAYAVRAADQVGFLSARQELRFTVGLGIVDADGKLVQDTVAPPAVQGLRARPTRRGIVLSWQPVADRGGLAGYRVDRNGAVYTLSRKTSLAVRPGKARARWTVRAVDRAGNMGPPAAITVR